MCPFTGDIDGLAAALELASRPNYLGSPQVVRDVITPLFASKVGWWLHLQDPSMPALSASEVQEVEQRIASIFAGENPEYTAMPWRSVEQLGQSAVARFNLNADYCAGESMFFVMLESVSAVALAINSLLKDYLADESGQWSEAIRQLHELQKFVESVLLGTADVTHPGKTLSDFRWQSPEVEEEGDVEEEGPIDPHIHPCPNDKGQVVHIKHPHTATPENTWSDSNAIATFVPGGDCPRSINGISCESWENPPEGQEWDEVDGLMDELEEPALDSPIGLKAATGCVIEEPDGRVWLVSPTNEHGGYKTTFPKGTLDEDDDLSYQANAIKEAYEEAGLQVRIIGFIGDVRRTTSVTRYYRAVRMGGMPVDMGWESQAVHLVPINKLAEVLDSPYDRKVMALAYGNMKPE